MQTRNIFYKLPVVIIIAIVVTCTVGIIVVFNYHEMFETDAVKVTSNTSNDGKPDPTVSERTAVHTTHQYSPNFVPGSTFSQNDPGNVKTRYVYDSTRIDADGDGAADDVLLVGENNDPSASFGNQTRNLAVVVRDGVSNNPLFVDLSHRQRFRFR